MFYQYENSSAIEEHGSSHKPPAGKIRVHVISAVLLLICWFLLNRWYSLSQTIYYLLFVVLFAGVIRIAAWPYLRTLIRPSSAGRWVIVVVLFFVALPWAEWLHLSTKATRENWSRHLFLEFVFVYAFLLTYRAFPALLSFFEAVSKSIERLGSRKFFVYLPPVLFFLLTGWISVFLFQKTPILPDSSAHLFQAKIFHQGKLFAPAPPLPELFSGPLDLLVIRDGKWFGMYPPGYALLLSAAMWFRLEWLFSPFIGALTVGIWLSYARRWHNRNVASLFGWLCLFSPFLLLMSSTVMVYPSELFLASSVIYVGRRQTEDPTVFRCALIFLLLATGILVRAFSLLPFLLPVLFYVSWRQIRMRSILFPTAALLGIATGASLLMYYQFQTTGNPFVPAYFLEFADIGSGFGDHLIGYHGPLRALQNSSNNLLGLDYWLTGWYSGSLIFLIVFFLRKDAIQIWDRVILIGSVFVIGFYFVRYYQDLWFGPRYWYVFSPFLLLLIARIAYEQKKVLIPLALAGLLLTVPFRLSGFVLRYVPAEKQAGKLMAEIHKVGKTKTLVFLDDEISQNFVNWNDPFLKGPVIVCRDPKGRQKEVQAIFPGYRPVFFRMLLSFDRHNLNTGFGFYNEPDRRPPGHVSLFEVASALLNASNFGDRDFFDICYVDLFNSSDPSSDRLSYLDNQLLTANAEPTEYKRNYRIGLIHVARMLLLPKLAFEERGRAWNNGFSFERFHFERQSAEKALKASGEIGASVLVPLDKLRSRIDHNNDHVLSDEETYQFLSEKILLLIGGDSL